MKKKLLSCVLAALICLQPASTVLAEDLDLGDSSGILAETNTSSETNTELPSAPANSEPESTDIVSDTVSDDSVSDDSVSDDSASDDSASDDSAYVTPEEPDVSASASAATADELTQDFSDDSADTLQQEPDDGSAADL